jgi:hypothetical protein
MALQFFQNVTWYNLSLFRENFKEILEKSGCKAETFPSVHKLWKNSTRPAPPAFKKTVVSAAVSL